MADYIEDREPRLDARRVRSGEMFDSDELADGRVILEEVEANRNPPDKDDQAEPWGTRKHRLRHRRLHEYERFLDERGYDRERDERGD
jgi:hypothetical protein